MVTVIIVTKNRAFDIEYISLASLLAQDTSDFEVIVWDASEGEKTKGICEKYADGFFAKNVDLRYFRATRVGIASQRNDAVAKASGDVVFFLDDDSDVSEDGIRIIGELFAQDSALMGGARPLEEVPRDEARHPGGNISGRKTLKAQLRARFGYVKKRTVNFTGFTRGALATFPEAQWLSGCSMAFRRSVFDEMRFNETLETFAPYANGEDVEFSHRVYRRYGPLRIAAAGKVVHRPAPGSRVTDVDRWIATLVFNRFHVMEAASGRLFWLGFLGYCWSMLRLGRKMSRRFSARDVLHGYGMAIKALRCGTDGVSHRGNELTRHA